MNGKGSKPRPFSVSQDKFAENWDRVFGKPKKEAKPDTEKKSEKK